MNSKNDWTGALEALEIKVFFAAQPWLADLLQNVLKILCMDYNSVIAYLEFSWKWKNKFLPSSGIPKTFRKKQKTVNKSNIK